MLRPAAGRVKMDAMPVMYEVLCQGV